MMSIVYGPKWPFYSCYNHIELCGTDFMQVMYLGRAPRTKETLPDFLKWRRVSRHPQCFCGLTGSQRTPGFGASHICCKICNIMQTLDNYVVIFIFIARKRVLRNDEY